MLAYFANDQERAAYLAKHREKIRRLNNEQKRNPLTKQTIFNSLHPYATTQAATKPDNRKA